MVPFYLGPVLVHHIPEATTWAPLGDPTQLIHRTPIYNWLRIFYHWLVMRKFRLDLPCFARLNIMWRTHVRLSVEERTFFLEKQEEQHGVVNSKDIPTSRLAVAGRDCAQSPRNRYLNASPQRKWHMTIHIFLFLLAMAYVSLVVYSTWHLCEFWAFSDQIRSLLFSYFIQLWTSLWYGYYCSIMVLEPCFGP